MIISLPVPWFYVSDTVSISDELVMEYFILQILVSFDLLSLFSYLWRLCYFSFPWWSPCCREELFLTILYIAVKTCYCILYTCLHADKSSASFFSFDVQPTCIVLGWCALCIFNNLRVFLSISDIFSFF